MPGTNYTTNLRLANPSLNDTGWGTTVSSGMIDLTDQAIAGLATADVTLGDVTLTIVDGSAGVNSARNMFLNITGTPGVARAVIVPTNRKLYFVTNNCGQIATVKVSGQTGVAVPAGATMALRINAAGTDVVQAFTNAVSPSFTGTPTAPTAAYGTNTTQLATTAFVQAALQALHPVGSIYINATSSTNPATLFGFGTWVAFGAGRVPVGFDSGNPLFDSAEETGGSADAIVVSHTHTLTDPGHTHTTTVPTSDTGNSKQALYSTDNAGTTATITSSTATTGISANTAGSSGTNANYQPYITVYMWKRTA